MKRVLTVLLAICFMVSSGLTVFATEITGEGKDVSCAVGGYNTEEEKISGEEYDIVDFYVTDNIVEIKNSGESAWIEAKGVLEDGTVVDLSQSAEWHSDNSDIIFADQGRLLALMPGETEIEVKYGEFSKIIKAKVVNDIDIALMIAELNENQVMTFAANNAIDRGKEMVEYSWTPKADLRGWRNGKTFSANVTYTGIPYSQTAYQVDKAGFASAMAKVDFYENYTRNSVIMPKYGNDCSGFVSFCWGISRQTTASFVAGIRNGTYTKVGTYDANNPTTVALTTSYRNLAPGNAVVKEGHTFLIAANDRENQKVYVYEQTPYTAIYTSWSYADLAAGKYMPFFN